MCMTTHELSMAIKAACPAFVTIRINDPADKQTWEAVYQDSATAEQIAAAQAVIEGVTPPLVMVHRSMTTSQFYTRLTEAERAALKASTDATVSSWRELLLYCGIVEIDTEESEALQAYLVSIGFFTSARIAEIFK